MLVMPASLNRDNIAHRALRAAVARGCGDGTRDALGLVKNYSQIPELSFLRNGGAIEMPLPVGEANLGFMKHHNLSFGDIHLKSPGHTKLM